MLDEFKKNKNFKFTNSFDLEKVPDLTPLAPNEQSDVEIMIQKLPKEQKLAVQMRYVDDKTFDEIAISLNTSSMNVRKVVSRGIKRLKQLMNQGSDQ